MMTNKTNNNYFSKGTFTDEYLNLQNNVPQAFWGDTHRYYDFTKYPFEYFRAKTLLPKYTNQVGLLDDYEENEFPDFKIIHVEFDKLIEDLGNQDIEDKEFFRIISEVLGFDVSKAFDFYIQNSEKNNREGFNANQTTKFDDDCYACYLPMHAFFRSKSTPWGIYMYQSLIFEHAADLYKKFKKDITKAKCLHFFWMSVYRHELYHYQIERFATKFEIAMQKPFYKPYVENVRYKVQGTLHWLEEALAEASVLKSNLITHRTNIKKGLLKEIYEYDLQFAGPGYKDYKCEFYDGPDKANLYLGAQILTGQRKPLYKITEFISPKYEYSSNDRAVPGYAIISKYDIERFQ